MKAILEFTLPEDDEAFQHALHALDYRRVIEEFDQWLRNAVKYGDGDLRVNILQEARDYLWELRREHGDT